MVTKTVPETRRELAKILRAERDKALRERDEARAEVERLKRIIAAERGRKYLETQGVYR